MSDNDLIRRGEVRELLQQCGLMGNHPNDPLTVIFNEIPCVDVKELVEAATGVMARLVVAFPAIETYPPTVRLAAALAALEKENGE